MRHAYIVGNAALDEVFEVESLPKRGESILGHARPRGLGGKGVNQAVALARTGVPTTLVSAVGDDWIGDLIREGLAAEPLNLCLLERKELASDRSIILQETDATNVIVTTNLCASSLSVDDCVKALSGAKPGDILVLQGNLDIQTTLGLIDFSKDTGLMVYFNPSPYHAEFAQVLPKVDVLFVNQVEASLLTGKEHERALGDLMTSGPVCIVMTLGAEGAWLGRDGDVVQVPALEAKVVDVTGAGDCFEGVAIGSSLLRNKLLDERALRHGAMAACEAIGRVGALRSFPNADTLSHIVLKSF